MSSAAPFAVVQEVQTIVQQINTEHRAAEAAQTSALQHARQAGILLQQQKVRTPHGSWQTWVKENCEFSSRTARLYMQLAQDWFKVEAVQNGNGVANLSLREAAGLIAECSDDDPEPVPAQEDPAPEPETEPVATAEPDGSARTRAPAGQSTSDPEADPVDEPERDPETGETLDDVMPADLDEATVYRQENERLEKRNAELLALLFSLQHDDQALEIVRLHDELARLNGLLDEKMTTAAVAQKQANRYGKIVARLRKILGVEGNGEVVPTVQRWAERLRELDP